MYWPDVLRVLAIVLCLLVMVGLMPAMTVREPVPARYHLLGIILLVLYGGGVVAMLYNFGEPFYWWGSGRYILVGVLGLLYIYLSLSQFRAEQRR